VHINETGIHTSDWNTPFRTLQSNVSTFKNRDGTGVPGWREKLRRCIDASSAYHLSERKVDGVSTASYSGNMKIFLFPVGTTPNFITYEGDARANGQGFIFPSNADPTTLVPTSTLNDVKRKFVNRCLNEQRTFQGGVVAGELHKTYESLRHPLTALRSGVSSYLDLVKERGQRAARKRTGSGSAGSSQRRRNVAKAIQGTYLEFVYGIQPTLMDMQDAVKTAAHLFNPELPMRSHVSTSGSFSYHVESLDSVQNPNLPVETPEGRVAGLVGQTRFVYAEGKVQISGALRNICPGSDRVKLLGLSLRDFVPTVWELLPYSFLVDYFTNVGDIFDALSFNVSDLAYSSMSVKAVLLEHFTDSQPNWLTGNPNTLITPSGGSPFTATLRTVSYVRNRLEPLDLIPTVQFSIPTGKQILNTTVLLAQHSKVVNILSKLI